MLHRAMLHVSGILTTKDIVSCHYLADVIGYFRKISNLVKLDVSKICIRQKDVTESKFINVRLMNSK